MPDIPSRPIEDKLAKFAESLRAHRPGITDEQILNLFANAAQIGKRFNVDTETALAGLAARQDVPKEGKGTGEAPKRATEEPSPHDGDKSAFLTVYVSETQVRRFFLQLIDMPVSCKCRSKDGVEFQISGFVALAAMSFLELSTGSITHYDEIEEVIL